MTPGATAWARRNLFRSPSDTILSLIAIPITVLGLYEVAHWAIAVADWSVVVQSLRFLLIGTIPADGTWRAWVATGCLAALFGATLGQFFRITKVRSSLVVLALGVLIALVFEIVGITGWGGLLACLSAAGAAWIVAARTGRAGRSIGLIWLIGLGVACAILAPTGTNRWGGLLLSVLVTAISTLISLPLGILLALGRRSRIVSVRIVCTAYIELMRSVPLLSVIYWAWIVVPLVLPPNFYVLSLVRGIAGFVFFYAAFVAEYVRAGLQGVHDGQEEAADALGLSAYDKNVHILLPQALRTVIPALVGNVLDIFNNVPLVFIIGLTDFLQAGQTILDNPQYSGAQFEVYGFLFAVYLIIGALVSYTSRRLEFSLHVSHR